MHSLPQFEAHCSITPTIKLIKRLFVWSRMKKNITEYCKKYQVYCSTKMTRAKTLGTLVPLLLLTKTFHHLHVNSIVGLPIIALLGKYTYVLVII